MSPRGLTNKVLAFLITGLVIALVIGYVTLKDVWRYGSDQVDNMHHRDKRREDYDRFVDGMSKIPADGSDAPMDSRSEPLRPAPEGQP